MLHRKIFGLLAITCVLSSTSGYAQVTTVPPGLNPGDPYRLAFVTKDNIFTATSTNIADYDVLVTSQANISTDLIALGTTWRVIGSTSSVDAKVHTDTDDSAAGANGVPIYRLDGLIIANDYDDLWDGTINNPLKVTQEGTAQSTCAGAWTGTSTVGIAVAGNELGAPSLQVVDGSPDVSNAGWIQTSPFSASSLQCLYAISDVLIAPGAVTIDIQTGKQTVCKGTISVAVLGSSTLDVIQIDQSTLSFDGLDVDEKRNGSLFCTLHDTNNDGFTDLVCRYQNAPTDGTLTGNLLDGSRIQGIDTYCVL